MVQGAGLLYTTLLSFPLSLQGNWSVWFMDRFAIYYATVFSYIFLGLLVYMVHGAGLLYTALLSFPISLQGYWSIWFMGQVCYILRYCLFLYLFRVTGLYGSWGRFAIYYATVFLYLYRVTGLYGSWGRFAIYCATVFSYIFTG